MGELFLSFFGRNQSTKNEALSDAYTIHGDGVAKLVPEKLVKRPQFQKNLTAISELELPPNADDAESNT